MWRMNPDYARIRKGEYPMENEHTEVKKSWGSEIWFANTENYCGKLLTVNPEEWSSRGKFHYHKIKDETFFVVEGGLWLDIANDDDGEYQRLSLKKYDSYRVMPGVKHRFSAISKWPCKFIEASTHHDEEDSYRCYYDEEKEEWVHV